MSAVTIRSFRNRLEGLGEFAFTMPFSGQSVSAPTASKPATSGDGWLPALFGAVGQIGAAGAQAVGSVMTMKQYVKGQRAGAAPPPGYGPPPAYGPVPSGPGIGTFLVLGALGVGAYFVLKG